MTGFRALLPARVAAALAVGTGALVATAAPATAAETAPLAIHLDSVSPAVIPRKGPITITGTVTNSSKAVWRSVSMYPLLSSTPLTTGEDLLQAAATDPDAVIGDRIVADGRPVGTLRPGQTRSFTVVVRHRDLTDPTRISGAPGVYWLGIHALGDSSATGTDNVADGRARTFIPLMPARKASRPVPVSLVVPLRHEVDRNTDGRVSEPKSWADDISPTGALGRVLGFAESAGAQPFTWLVDPEALQAIGDLANGNPGTDLAAATAPASPSASASPTTGSPGPGSGSVPNAFQGWLRMWTSSAQQHPVLTLPYADPDVSAIGIDHLDLLQKAWRLGGSVLSSLKVKAGRAVAPVDGSLDPRALAPQAPGTTILTRATGSGSRVTAHAGLRYAQTDPLVDADTNATDLVDVRQRILAEAALRSLAHSHTPLVVVMPAVWSADPVANDAFFQPFGTLGWTRLAPLPTGAGGRAKVPWSARARSVLVPHGNIAASAHLARTAATATTLFDDDGVIGTRLTGMALAGVSQNARVHPADIRTATLATNAAMKLLLGNIQVEGSDFVTLSGASGILTMSIHNGLNQPVRVGLAIRADDSGLRLTAPAVAELAAVRRTTVRIQASTRSVGVHEVHAQPVTATGTTIGRPFVFAVRTSQIGQFFWYVVLAGTALVALLIARRARLRLRARRNARADSDEPAGDRG